jgi:pilus assembly protein Flp/PilA
MPRISATSEGKEVRRMEKIKNFIKGEEGVTAIEYGLIAALIAVAIIVAVTAVGTNLATIFTTISTKLAAAGG